MSNPAVEMTETDAIHGFFGLSYSTYLVLHRSLLQSMPHEWQTEFVALLNQLQAAFRHVEQTESYDLIPGTQCIVDELGEKERKILGITTTWDELSEEEAEDFKGEILFYNRDGDEIPSYHRVIVPGEEKLPGYQRGRTRIDVNMAAYSAARSAAPSSPPRQEGKK